MQFVLVSSTGFQSYTLSFRIFWLDLRVKFTIGIALFRKYLLLGIERDVLRLALKALARGGFSERDISEILLERLYC